MTVRYATHLGYSPPTLRPQFLETVGTDEPAAHIRYAAQEGMAGVLYPWAIEKSPTERETVRRALVETGLACSCIGALPLELAASPIWTDRSRRSRTALEAAIVAASNVAVSLSSTVLAVIVAADPDRADDGGQHDDLVSNLRDIAPIAQDHGLTVGVEPMLRMPAPLLRTTAAAAAIIVATGQANVGLVYDTTHVSMMDGDLLPVLTQYFEHIVSLQLSDEPGRVEPGAGNLPLVEVTVEAARRGYTGLVDLEHGWLDPTKAGEQAGLARVRVFDSQVSQALTAPERSSVAP
jgi:hydroxypyruvate isomerase